MITAECQQTRDLLDSYLCAELLVETNHQILRHLAGCDGCRAELARRQQVRTLMKLAMSYDDPPADVVRRIAAIPRASGGPGLRLGERVRAFWHRRRTAARPHGEVIRLASAPPTSLRQALVGVTLGALLLAVFGAVPWPPWAEMRLTASELLARSDEATRAIASRSDVVLHRSLHVEERRGRGGPVVARRRIEVWQSASSGVAFRRAFNERNVLVAGESLARNGMRTVYGAGSPPDADAPPVEHARLSGLEQRDNHANAVWRLDLSAREYISLVPSVDAVRVDDLPGYFVLTYEAPAAPARAGAGSLIGATLKLHRESLLPVEQTLVIERHGDVREYTLSEARFRTVPSDQVPAAVFEPDAVFIGVRDHIPARSRDTEPIVAPEPVVRPSLEAELDLVYRLHRVDAWLRDSVEVSRTSRGTLEISARVLSAERRKQLLAVLTPAAGPGVAIDIQVMAKGASDPIAPARSPDDPRRIAMYDDLRAGFVEFIRSRISESDRRSPEEERRLVDDLVRALANRNLERSHDARIRAVALERTIRQFSSPGRGRLSPDAEATLQTMLRDYARGIEFRLEALRLELQPIFKPEWSVDALEPHSPAPTIDLTGTAERLRALVIQIDDSVVEAFGASGGRASGGRFNDPAWWRAIAEAERLAGVFKEPLPLGAR